MEETIDLRRIIEILLKGKWVLVICIIVAVLFAAIVSWFVVDESYSSNATVQVKTVVQQEDDILTKYIAASYTPVLYMKQVQGNGVVATNAPNTNFVELTATASTAGEAQQKLQQQIDEAATKMDSSIKETFSELERMYAINAEGLSNEVLQLINQYNNLLDKQGLPTFLLLQNLTSNQVEISVTAEQAKVLSTVDPAIQHELYQLQAQVTAISIEHQKILKKQKALQYGQRTNSSESFLQLIVEPTLVDSPASPNKTLNLLVGLVVGLMIGLGVVFLRAYWRSTEK